MSVSKSKLIEIAPRSAQAFELVRGQRLRVVDPLGEQVADLVCFSGADRNERLSSGRSLDYAGKWRFSTGDVLYSNRSRAMLAIVEDAVGCHDFLLTPCSRDTFRILYRDENPHPGCQENLQTALRPFGIADDDIPVSFNVFMNAPVSPDGSLEVLPPLSRPGDAIVFEARMDLVVGLTACSAELTNHGRLKPIAYRIET